MTISQIFILPTTPFVNVTKESKDPLDVSLNQRQHNFFINNLLFFLLQSHASPSAERREHLYKILVIGELGTGKTSIIKRYVHQFFSQHYRATIGVDFALKVLNWDANTIIRLQLWDIAGKFFFNQTSPMTLIWFSFLVPITSTFAMVLISFDHLADAMDK